MKGRMPSGRKVIKPLEAIYALSKPMPEEGTVQDIDFLLDSICANVPIFHEYIATK